MFRTLCQWLFASTPARKVARTAQLGVHNLDERIVPSTTIVNNTSGYPNRAVVKIEASWDLNRNGRIDSGETWVGTGNLVSEKHVLTAGHVIYDNDPSTSKSGFATWVKVIPGLNGTSKPYGEVWATRLGVPSSWTTGSTWSDLGMMTLGSSIGTTVGWFGYSAPNLSAGSTVNMLHYPASEGFPGNRQYFSSGPINQVNSANYRYRETDIRSVGGSSGAGLYTYNSSTNQRSIVGVNVRSDTGTNGYAYSVRLNSTWLGWMNNFRAANNRPADATSVTKDMETGTFVIVATAGVPEVKASEPTKPTTPRETRVEEPQFVPHGVRVKEVTPTKVTASTEAETLNIFVG
jgi:V8-like Glu-specific endopeptidase